MGKLRVYCLETLNKLSIYPLGNTPSAPSVTSPTCVIKQHMQYQGVTPSNSKGGLPALEAETRTQRGTMEIPSKLSDPSEEAHKT